MDKSQHKDLTPVQDINMYLAIKESVLSVRARMGNCGETSTYAFLFLILNFKSLDPYLEHVCAKDSTKKNRDNHAFVVMNRDKNKDIEDISNWNKEAIIVDPCVFINQDDYEIFNSTESRGKDTQNFSVPDFFEEISGMSIELIQGGYRSHLLTKHRNALKHILRRKEMKEWPKCYQNVYKRLTVNK